MWKKSGVIIPLILNKPMECYSCSQPQPNLQPCPCWQRAYCSPQCREKDQSHQLVCQQLQTLKAHCPGYNDSLGLTQMGASLLKAHGARYLDAKHPGVVTFCRWPLSADEFLQNRLGADNQAAAYHFCDFKNRHCIHYFITPLISVQEHMGFLPPPFLQLLADPVQYQHLIPVVELIGCFSPTNPEPEITKFKLGVLLK